MLNYYISFHMVDWDKFCISTRGKAPIDCFEFDHNLKHYINAK